MFLYNLAIAAYGILARIDAGFHLKTRLMIQGQKATFDMLRHRIEPGKQYIWFHAASLGEFEQGRPLMERIRAMRPDLGILLTFFSPSGYEVRKDYKGADIICYLPFDTPGNVRMFMDLARPSMAFFIKYEFWKNYLDALKKRGTPIFSISSIFRPSQFYFRWFGTPLRGMLRNFDRLFVQDERSRNLLEDIGILQVSVTGDTRFDRVLQIRDEAKKLEAVEGFISDARMVLIAGSSWQPDEDLLLEYFNTHPEMKLIIAPHVIDQAHLREIEGKLRRNHLRYTRLDSQQQAESADCLIIDCFGLLSSIYRYADIAYVGGGFGAGIHNTLEAAVWAKPVIFGPRHEKFKEAAGLIHSQGGFSISSRKELYRLLDRFLSDRSYLEDCGGNAGRYVLSKAGSTDRILQAITLPPQA